MSSSVVYEALALGFKEGAKIGVLWLVFRSYLLLRGKIHYRWAFFGGAAVSLLLSWCIPLLSPDPAIKQYIGSLIPLSFAFFLIAGVWALLDSLGVHVYKPLGRVIRGTRLIQGLLALGTIFFFFPDNAGTVLFLRELTVLKGQIFPVYASAAAGFLLAMTGYLVLVQYASAALIASFFDAPQLLLFVAMVKLFGGGAKGIAEISLIPSVQRGLMKFSHDIIHQTFVFLMVPDHPLLKTTVWNFIGFFFGSNIALWESLAVLLFFPLVFIWYSLMSPLPGSEADSGAERRKLASRVLSDRRRKALPVIIFVCIILGSWFSQGGESVSTIYVPKPKPVVEDKGIVMIPVNDPTMDLRDGALHKFALLYQGREIRLIVIRKPDGRLATCLDACEICPPDGYGQREDHVVCLYCKTPIPVSTLGEPGGCNPIPLASTVDDRFVRVPIEEIVRKWEYVNSGKSREGIR